MAYTDYTSPLSCLSSTGKYSEFVIINLILHITRFIKCYILFQSENECMTIEGVRQLINVVFFYASFLSSSGGSTNWWDNYSTVWCFLLHWLLLFFTSKRKKGEQQCKYDLTCYYASFDVFQPW